MKSDAVEAKTLWRGMVEGKLRAAIVGIEKPAIAAKYASTMARRGKISGQDLVKVLAVVETESVRPFSGKQGKSRRIRFAELQSALL